MTVETPAVQIDWDRDFGGETSVEVGDPDGLITDVGVTAEVVPPNNVLAFEFTPTRAFDAGTVAVQTWDASRNPWTNYFYDAMRIVPGQEPAEAADAATGAIPAWVRDSAGWWADGMIDDGAFVEAVQYLIGAGIMQAPPAGPAGGGDDGGGSGGGIIPAWVRNSAGWWADGMIDDGTFVEAIQYLAAKGIIRA